jgi:DNA-binding MarR family transcriptional regulator
MTDQHTLIETERAMRDHVSTLELDFEAAHAVSSLYRAANAVRSHVTNEVLREYDISWTGFVVLWVVWIFDGIETRHAAEASAISKATLTGVVKTLEGRGWLVKQAMKEDRRRVALHLTPAGMKFMEELYPRFNAVESKVVADLNLKQCKQMTESLRVIVTTIEGMDGVSATV